MHLADRIAEILRSDLILKGGRIEQVSEKIEDLVYRAVADGYISVHRLPCDDERIH